MKLPPKNGSPEQPAEIGRRVMPYRGAAAVMTDLLSGQVQLYFGWPRRPALLPPPLFANAAIAASRVAALGSTSRLVASALAALLSQRLPPRYLRLGRLPIQKHVQRDVGVLPADQRASVGGYDMQLSVTEVVPFEPLDL